MDPPRDATSSCEGNLFDSNEASSAARTESENFFGVGAPPVRFLLGDAGVEAARLLPPAAPRLSASTALDPLLDRPSPFRPPFAAASFDLGPGLDGPQPPTRSSSASPSPRRPGHIVRGCLICYDIRHCALF